MKSRQPSGTYKKLYNNIIADLIFQICNANHDLGARTIIRGDILPVALWKKIETYEAVALENMSGKRLDRHKLASCICGAIIEIKPIVNLKRNDIRKNVNEILALYTALNVIKAFMIYDLIGEKTDRGSDELRQHLRSSFDMKLPSMDENICDTQDYRKNIIGATRTAVLRDANAFDTIYGRIPKYFITLNYTTKHFWNSPARNILNIGP